MIPSHTRAFVHAAKILGIEPQTLLNLELGDKAAASADPQSGWVVELIHGGYTSARKGDYSPKWKEDAFRRWAAWARRRGMSADFVANAIGREHSSCPRPDNITPFTTLHDEKEATR